MPRKDITGTGVPMAVIEYAEHYQPILERLDPVEAARFILADSTGYRERDPWHSTDVEKLAGALIAMICIATGDYPVTVYENVLIRATEVRDAAQT